MKIMVVTNGWGVNTMGGGEYHILNVLSNWAKDNDVCLIIPKSGFELSKKMISDKCVTYFSSNEPSVNSLKANLFFYVVRIVKSMLVRTVKPDVVVSASHLLYDVLPAFVLSKRFNAKLVVYNHSIINKTRKMNDGLYSALSLINEKLGIYFSRNANLIFTVNNDTKNFLLNRNFKKEQIFSTTNGVEKNFIYSVNNNKKEFDGCFCGRITKIKGVFDILEIWQQVVNELPNAKFLFIGNGPDYDIVSSLLKEKNLEKHVVLKGFLTGKEKIEAIKSAKVFLFPSYEEGWGIAISEALLCELAVICYDLEAYDIFGNGITKIKLGDVNKMAKVTIELLSDEEKRAESIKWGTNVMDHFKEWGEIAEEQSQQLVKQLKVNT
jgi:glycosyltransferase involved in cell wall biosynthesis